jgi:hypothetical protein
MFYVLFRLFIFFFLLLDIMELIIFAQAQVPNSLTDAHVRLCAYVCFMYPSGSSSRQESSALRVVV